MDLAPHPLASMSERHDDDLGDLLLLLLLILEEDVEPRRKLQLSLERSDCLTPTSISRASNN
jgi:hypothetical protein